MVRYLNIIINIFDKLATFSHLTHFLYEMKMISHNFISHLTHSGTYIQKPTTKAKENRAKTKEVKYTYKLIKTT